MVQSFSLADFTEVLFSLYFLAKEFSQISDRHCGRDKEANFTKLLKEGKKVPQSIMNSSLFENNVLVAMLWQEVNHHELVLKCKN